MPVNLISLLTIFLLSWKVSPQKGSPNQLAFRDGSYFLSGDFLGPWGRKRSAVPIPKRSPISIPIRTIRGTTKKWIVLNKAAFLGFRFFKFS